MKIKTKRQKSVKYFDDGRFYNLFYLRIEKKIIEQEYGSRYPQLNLNNIEAIVRNLSCLINHYLTRDPFRNCGLIGRTHENIDKAWLYRYHILGVFLESGFTEEQKEILPKHLPRFHQSFSKFKKYQAGDTAFLQAKLVEWQSDWCSEYTCVDLEDISKHTETYAALSQTLFKQYTAEMMSYVCNYFKKHDFIAKYPEIIPHHPGKVPRLISPPKPPEINEEKTPDKRSYNIQFFDVPTIYPIPRRTSKKHHTRKKDSKRKHQRHKRKSSEVDRSTTDTLDKKPPPSKLVKVM